MAKHEGLFNAILRGQQNDVKEILTQELAQNSDVTVLLMESMIPAMREMGDRFSRNEAFVPEMLIAARAMQTGLDLIEPNLAAAGHKAIAKVGIGTVKGDLHDIGKNLVAMMAKGAGFEVIDLGVDCDVAKFKGAVDQGASVVMLSALLTTTMPYMKEVVESLKDRNVKVMVGGAPVTQEYADTIGAHGYAEDANMAVRTLETLVA
jgi:5-methyltetrahydrofolate--homocysteine methyltransferase